MISSDGGVKSMTGNRTVSLRFVGVRGGEGEEERQWERTEKRVEEGRDGDGDGEGSESWSGIGRERWKGRGKRRGREGEGGGGENCRLCLAI